MKDKIVFFGAGPYVDAIIEILKQNFDLVQIVSSKEILDDNLISMLKQTGTRVAVLASFGQIIPDRILNLFECGIINIHPSLLPKYRGATPIQTAILNGDTTTGVSIMKLDTEMDHGPLLAQIEQQIEPNDTSESLYKHLFKLGAEKLVEILPQYLSGELALTEQDHTKATYTDQLTRESGLIDINSDEFKIENLKLKINAYHPWPGVWFKASSELTTQNSKLNEKIIKLLPENRIQVEGKNIMSFKDFANGYPEGKEILDKLNLNAE